MIHPLRGNYLRNVVEEYFKLISPDMTSSRGRYEFIHATTALFYIEIINIKLYRYGCIYCFSRYSFWRC